MLEPLTQILFILRVGIPLLRRSLGDISGEKAMDLLQDVGGNLSYDLLKKGGLKAVSLIVARMKAEDAARRPTNRHLQKAVRKAQLSATFLALQACWKEVNGKDPTFLSKFLQPVTKRFLSNEERQLIEVRKWLLEGLRETDRPDYVGPYEIDYDDLLQLANPLNEDTDLEALQEVANELKRRTIDELYSMHPSMRVLARVIEHGWEIPIRKNDEPSDTTSQVVKCDWFSLVYEYFGEEYKQGREVTQALNRLLFYEIKDDIGDLPNKILNSHFDEIGGSLLKSLKRIEDKQDKILREVRRRPFYARWQGKEYADKVERLVIENSRLLVGRDEELVAMDEFVANTPCGYYLIKGGPGFGKSSLLAGWVRSRRFEGRFIAYHFFSRRHDTTGVSSGFRNLLSQLRVYYEIDEDLPARDESREAIYGLIQERKARPDEPLVIVLDGLDEASDPFSPPFSPLPENVFVIISVRAEDYDTGLPYLRDWTSITEPNTKTLSGLDVPGIIKWLEYERLNQNEKLTLSQMKEDQKLAKKIHEKTLGFPLYLSYLIPTIVEKTRSIEDDTQRHNTFLKVLDSTPDTFRKYLVEQYRELCGAVSSIELRSIAKLFQCLSVALGPLSTYDVWKLCSLKPETLNYLMVHAKARRWFRWRDSDSHQALFYFDHPLIQKEFRETVLIETDEAHSNLLKYCGDWREHPRSTYSFRYYPEHLFTSKQWGSLSNLARDEEFLNAQQKAFPDEPDISLRTLQIALNGAIDRDAAGAMAEFSIRHSSHVAMIEDETPLGALEVGGLQRALSLAELQFVRDKERGVLWYLCLAIQLKLKDRNDEARRILTNLSVRECAQLQDGFGNLAIIALMALLDIDNEAWIQVQKQLLDDDQRMVFVTDLSSINYAAEPCMKDRFDLALALAHQIKESLSRAPALATIARSQALAGDLNAALESIKKIEYAWSRAKTLTEIGQALASSGNRQSALECFQYAFEAVRGEELHFDIVTEIARAQAEIGELNLAIETVLEIKNSENRANGLTRILRVPSANQNPEALREGLQYALEAAREETTWRRAEALADIARILVSNGELSTALDIAREIEEPERRAAALVEIAPVQAMSGDREGALLSLRSALDCAHEIKDSEKRSLALAEIGTVLAANGNLDEAQMSVRLALDSARDIEHPVRRARGLTELARILSKNGHRELALESFQYALTSAHEIDSLWTQTSVKKDIAEALAANGELSIALEIVRQGEDPKDRARMLAKIAESLMENTAVAAALDVVREIEDPETRLAALAKIPSRLAAKGDLAAALEVGQEIEDPGRRASALAEIVPALAASGELSAALEIAHEIGEPGARSVALAEIVRVLAASGTREATLNALDVARELQDPLERAAAVAEIARVPAASGNLQIALESFPYALETAQELEISSRRAEAMIEIARALAASDDRTAALRSFRFALETARGIEDFENRTKVLVDIAKGLAESEDREAALEIFRYALQSAREIELPWRRSEKVAEIARTLMANGELEAGLETAHELEDPDKRAGVLVEIAQVLAASGKRAAALENYRCALEAAHEIEAPRSPVLALEKIAVSQAAIGELSAALETARKIVDLESRTQALGEIARVQTARGDREEALEIFRYGLETAHEIRVPERRAEALTGIVTELAASGEIFAALDTAREIEVPWKRAITLANIAQGRAATGDREATMDSLRRALEAAREIKDTFHHATTLSKIARILLANGEIAVALDTAREIKDPWRRANEIALALAASGDREAALESFRHALQSAREIDHPQVLTETMVEIAKTQAVSGELPAALETAREIEFPFVRAGVLADIARAFAASGKREAALESCRYALEAAHEIEAPWSPVPALSAIAQAQAASGELDAALNTAREIEDPGFQTSVLAEIARAQAESGGILEVSQVTQTFLLNREKYLLYVAEAFVEQGDKVRFKQFLFPCAYFPEAAIRMAGLMSRLYIGQPVQLEGILTALREAL